MKIRTLLCLVFNFILVSSSFAAYAQNELKIMTEDWPPLNYRQGSTASGPAVDIVRSIQKKLDSRSNIAILPWKRAYEDILVKPNTMLFSMVRTREREHLFKWVGPVAEKKYAFYAKKGAGIHLNNIDEIRRYSIGVQNGGATQEYLRKNGFTKVEAITKVRQNLNKLLNGRIMLWYEK